MKCVAFFLLAMVVANTALSQQKFTSSDLVRKAIAQQAPAHGLLGGKTEAYLRNAIKTDKPIYGTASIVKMNDAKCARARIKITVPDLMVTATNPSDPKQVKTGPFETTIEGNFCERG